MNNVRDAEFSRETGGNAGAGPPFQTLTYSISDGLFYYFVMNCKFKQPVFNCCVITLFVINQVRVWLCFYHIASCSFRKAYQLA